MCLNVFYIILPIVFDYSKNVVMSSMCNLVTFYFTKSAVGKLLCESHLLTNSISITCIELKFKKNQNLQ